MENVIKASIGGVIDSVPANGEAVEKVPATCEICWIENVNFEYVQENIIFRGCFCSEFCYSRGLEACETPTPLCGGVSEEVAHLNTLILRGWA